MRLYNATVYDGYPHGGDFSEHAWRGWADSEHDARQIASGYTGIEPDRIGIDQVVLWQVEIGGFREVVEAASKAEAIWLVEQDWEFDPFLDRIASKTGSYPVKN